VLDVGCGDGALLEYLIAAKGVDGAASSCRSRM
jgi:cyclopropane fatty-acyl-phospholipid synthase-like methyltransferase